MTSIREGHQSPPERLLEACGVSDRALALDQAAEHVRAALPAHAPSARASSQATHGGVSRETDDTSHGVVGPANVNEEVHDDPSSAGTADPEARTASWRHPL